MFKSLKYFNKNEKIFFVVWSIKYNLFHPNGTKKYFSRITLDQKKKNVRMIERTNTHSEIFLTLLMCACAIKLVYFFFKPTLFLTLDFNKKNLVIFLSINFILDPKLINDNHLKIEYIKLF